MMAATISDDDIVDETVLAVAYTSMYCSLFLPVDERT
jgi:hypothetical protein